MEVNDSIAGYCSSSSLVISSDEMHLNPSLGLAVMLFCLASFQGSVLPSPYQDSSASATLNKIDLLNSYSSVVEEDYFSSSALDDTPGDGSREEPYGNYQQMSVQRRQAGLPGVHCRDICYICSIRRSLRISGLCWKQCPLENRPEFHACLVLYIATHPGFHGQVLP